MPDKDPTKTGEGDDTDDKDSKDQKKEGDKEQTPPVGDKTEKLYTKDQLEALIEERLGRARKSWDKDASKTKTDAEAAAAKASGDLQKQLDLTTQQLTEAQARITELEPLEERVKALEKLLQAHYEATLAELAPEARALLEELPGDPSIEAKLEWLNKNKAKFTAGVKAKGTPPATPPSGDKKKTEADPEKEKVRTQSSRSFIKRGF